MNLIQSSYLHPMQQAVAEFHRAFGLPDMIGSHQALPEDRIALRLDLIREEGVTELGRAIDEHLSGMVSSPVEIIDALIDTVYVALGGLVEMGRDVFQLHGADLGRCINGTPLVDNASKAATDIARLLGELERELRDGSESGGAALFSIIAWEAAHALWKSGLLIMPFFDEVQRANMSKLGADGRPVHSRGVDIDGYPEGKVLKGPGYSPPDLARVLLDLQGNRI